MEEFPEMINLVTALLAFAATLGGAALKKMFLSNES